MDLAEAKIGIIEEVEVYGQTNDGPPIGTVEGEGNRCGTTP